MARHHQGVVKERLKAEDLEAGLGLAGATPSGSGQGEVEGRRPRGGPRARWRDTIREWSRGG